MPFISTNYRSSPVAPIGRWTCSPTSKLKPFFRKPNSKQTQRPSYCGQCVSYVKQVTPSLPETSKWIRGELVKGNKKIKPGTVIATFKSRTEYKGHAAVYVSQDARGILVYDQWVSGKYARGVGSRVLRWGHPSRSSNGDKFYVVESAKTLNRKK